MFRTAKTKIIKRKSPVMIYIIKTQQPNHWAEKGEIYPMYGHGHIYFNVEYLNAHTMGAARSIGVADCEEL